MTPLEIDANATRHDASVAAIEAYTRRLELYVQTHPEQWVGWLNL